VIHSGLDELIREPEMSAAIPLRDDCDAYELRVLAGRIKDANQARRLLAVAAVYEGMDREEAARIGGMDRQTLRDWRSDWCGSGRRTACPSEACDACGMGFVYSEAHPATTTTSRLAADRKSRAS
jgi:Homeodomain-like domain